MEYAPKSSDNHNVKFWTARRNCALSAGWFTSGMDSLCKERQVLGNWKRSNSALR